MRFRLEVGITFKEGVLNPQDRVILNALKYLKYPGERLVFGRYVSYETNAENEKKARHEADRIFKDPRMNLTNFNTETYKIISVKRVEDKAAE